jgi:phosphatidate cytidylyltransferase
MSLDNATRTRLFDPRPAFDDPFVVATVCGVVAAMALLPLVAMALPARARADVLERWRGWLVLAPLIALPVLLGAAWVFVAATALALLCYREFARATGLFRCRLVSAATVLAILVTYFAAADNYYAFFVALWPLSVGLIALAGLVSDRPKGFIQRVGLAVLAYMLFGSGLGHLAFFANDPHFRAILVWLILSVELNDIFAFATGRALGPLTGGRKLAPNTSPNKTLAGGLGALVLTTALAAIMGRFVWDGTALAAWPHLVVMGLMIAVLGQAGDLLLSAVKRDLEMKDFGHLFRGHGGLLDRFDSLMLVLPALFHYIHYGRGVGNGQMERIFSFLWF